MLDDFQPYLQRLAELPFVRGVELAAAASAKTTYAIDALVQLRTPTGVVSLPAELKRTHLEATSAERFIHVASAVPGLLVLAPVVGRGIGARLAEAGVNYMDRAGNCRIQIGDAYLAHVQGLRAEAPQAADRSLRAAGYRVVFAMLAAPELPSGDVRALAEAAGGVSVQTAAAVRNRLLEQGALIRSAKRIRWAPSGWKLACDLFLGGFAATLLPNLLLGRFRARERNIDELEKNLAKRLGAEGWRWGGGAACARLTNHFRGDRTTVYLDHVSGRTGGELGLVADPRGPVALLRSPGPAARRSPHPDTVHPLLAYADLLAEGDERARDGARELHTTYILPLEAG